jgi:acetolactate synthase-1/2/3 large subunit
MATLGPGALNLVTGAAYAHLGAMPMILITGQKAIMSARQARFQIVDIVATMKPLTKSSRQIISAASIPTVVRDAFRLASEERPGPVHLELPRTSPPRSSTGRCRWSVRTRSRFRWRTPTRSTAPRSC